MNINECVARWRDIRKTRMELEHMAKQLASGPEAEARAQILMWMDANGLPGIKTDSGTVSRSKRFHIEIADMDTFCDYMVSQLSAAKAGGRPMVDGLLLQQRVLKSSVIEYLCSELGVNNLVDIPDEQCNTLLEGMGLKFVSYFDVIHRQ